MKLAKMFIENGAAGIHIEDLRSFQMAMFWENQKDTKIRIALSELTESWA